MRPGFSLAEARRSTPRQEPAALLSASFAAAATPAAPATPAETAHDTPASHAAKPLPLARSHNFPASGHWPLVSLASAVVLLLLWWISTQAGWLTPLVLPSPAAVGDAFLAAQRGELQGGHSLFEHFAWSTGRVLAGLLLACLTAIPLGLLMGVSRLARSVFDPPIEFYRPLPPLAYLPLIVIWFGIDETAKVLLIYLACFAPLVVSARAGVRSASAEQINAAQSLGATRWQVLRHVILPAALPEILTGVRIAVGFGWTTLVAAELVAATVGLGQLVMNASNFLRTDIVLMGILVIGTVAGVFDLLMRQVERRLVPWKGHR
nr:ABC transporter permease subunit [Rhodocyclus gracilis]